MLSALVHASGLCFSCCHLSSESKSSRPRTVTMATSARIAVVGDVHGDWNLQDDTKALQLLQPDLVLFTGDFGEEDVELVQSIADLKFAKAVILGNHDAWHTQQFSGKRKDGVQLQLESLGEQHVGYTRLDFPLVKLSVVGGRPFSHGGEHLFRKKLLSARYGVQDMHGSAKRIYEAAMGTPEGYLSVLLAHNGPTGLGSSVNDICGKDWVFQGGDHGDQDLAQAIALFKENGNHFPLVVFGHMHKELVFGNESRKMVVVGADDTIYLNGAIVPRVKKSIDEQRDGERSWSNSKMPKSSPVSRSTKRAFTVVDILDGKVDKIAEIWVLVDGDKTNVEEEHLLYKSGC